METLEPWIDNELAGCRWPDRRLGKRARRLLAAMSQKPAATIPECCGDWSQTKAAYGFFDHPELNFEGLLEGHQRATWQRISQCDGPVLLIEDSSAMNYGGHPATTGLGPIGSNAQGAQGLWLHSALAMQAEGGVLGFVHARCWARDAQKSGQRHRRHSRELEDKESFRWVSSLRSMACEARQWAPAVPLIRITDREGDLWAVLVEAHQRQLAGQPIHVLMRSRHDRSVQTAAGHQDSLWASLSQAALAATKSLSLPARPASPGKAACQAREAVLQVRFSSVRVLATAQSTADAPGWVDCWAVEAIETQPPPGCDALHWRLLTTWPVHETAEALEALRYYALRWQIEVMHKVLKSGLGVERRALRTGQRLEAALALSLIIAWRIMSLMHGSRHQPDVPAAQLLEPDECLLLLALRQRGARAQRTDEAFTMRQAVEELGRLGGWLGRKRDAPPGIIVLWRGLQCLHAQIQGFNLARQLMGNR